MTTTLLAQALDALEKVTQFAEAQICMHEETVRGGAIWEICTQCGAKWADDRGGKPAFKWPKETDAARAMMDTLRAHLAAQPALVPADLTMTRDELVAAAESIGMRFPAPAPVPVPLSDEQIDKILERERMRWAKPSPPTYEFALAFARAIERAHGIAASPEVP
jgi:hypothetical protein